MPTLSRSYCVNKIDECDEDIDSSTKACNKCLNSKVVTENKLFCVDKIDNCDTHYD